MTYAVPLGTKSRLWGRRERKQKKEMGEAERRMGGRLPNTIYNGQVLPSATKLASSWKQDRTWAQAPPLLVVSLSS